MSSISCYVRLSRPPLVRLRQRRVPALPACHISATFCARARSHARRIRPSMCEARATARAPRYRCIRDPCSHCLLPCLRTSSRVCCSCGRMRRARSSTRGDRQLHAGAGRRDGARAHRPRRRAAAEAQAALACTHAPCVAAARASHAGAIAGRVVRAVLCPSAQPSRPSGDPVRQRVAPAFCLGSVRAYVGVEQGERRIAMSACMSDAAGCTL